MPGLFEDFSAVGSWDGTVATFEQYSWDQIDGVERYDDPSWAGNDQETFFDLPLMIGGIPGTPPAEIGSGNLCRQTNHHDDFHFRLWITPSVVQLTNPPLEVNIPFKIWNTGEQAEEILAINVSGSSVLSFDISPGDILGFYELREANFQIGPGEPSIDAEVTIETDNLEGIFQILATISETFNLIPDVPVNEAWEFKTNILKNYRGDDQRIALRDNPRLKQEFDVEIVDVRQRREQFLLLRKNITVQTIIAFYQYASKINGNTLISENRFYFDPARTNARVGEFMAIVNTTTEEVILGRVDVIHSDGVTMNVVAENDILHSSQTWIAIPCFMCLVEDGSGLTMNTVTGTLSIKASSFSDPNLVRPDSTRTFTTFDGIPLLNRRPVPSAEESFSYRRQLIDNETGARDISSRDKHPEISGGRQFIIQRESDPEEMDFWRNFFYHVKGAQKSFLISTYFPDLTFSSGQLPLSDATSTFIVNEGEVKTLLTDFDGFSRFELEYSNKETSQHKILSSTQNIDGTMTISFSPSIPSGAIYQSPIKISYLMRVRATDRIAWSHFANYSEVSFGIFSTDQ